MDYLPSAYPEEEKVQNAKGSIVSIIANSKRVRRRDAAHCEPPHT